MESLSLVECHEVHVSSFGFAVLDEPDGQTIGLEPVAAHDSGLDPAGAGSPGLPLADWSVELVEDGLFGRRRAHAVE